MGVTPEENLKRSAATFRSKSQKSKRLQKSTDPNRAVIIGYNADLGKNIIQLPDGSISYAYSDTNGAFSLGDSVPRSEGTGNIDGLPNYKKQIVVVKKAKIILAHKLKVLVISQEDELNRIVLYVGSESKKVSKVWEDPNPSDDIFLLDSESRIRIDNKDFKKLDSWVVTGLWGDYTPRIDGQPLTTDPGVAKSIDSANYYENSIYDVNSIKISGAYFYTLTYNSRYNPFLNTSDISGTYNKNTVLTTNQTSIETETIDISVSVSRDFNSLAQGTLTEVPSSGFFQYLDYPSNNYPAFPSTIAKGGNPYLLGFFTGSSAEDSINNYESDYTNQTNQTNVNSSVSGTKSLTTLQSFPCIYKGVLTEVSSSETTNYSYSATFTRTDGENTFSDISLAQKSITPVTVNMLPLGAPEKTFSEEFDYSLNETGTYEQPPTPTFRTLIPVFNHPTISNSLYVNRVEASYINPSYSLIESASYNLYVNPPAIIITPGLEENRETLEHINFLTSATGDAGIIYVRDNHTNFINVVENNYRKTVVSYPRYTRGSYFYQKGLGDFISKRVIEFSGDKLILLNYSADFSNQNPVNQNSISTLINYPAPTTPESISLNQTLIFNDGDSYVQRFNLNQPLEFEYRNSDATQVSYGLAVVSALSIESVSITITEVTNFSTQEVQKYDLESFFGNNNTGLILKSLGGNILETFDENSSQSNITLVGDTLYKVTATNFDKILDAQKYYVFLDTYKILAYNGGGTVYLKREKPRFIECPEVAVDSIENVIFAYSE